MQVLRAVVISGSVSAAATNLGYTPSAISQQLSVLEREAGVPLLEKVGRGVRPTPAGTLLAERAGTLSQLLGETEAELAELRAGRTGLLRLLFFQSASVALVPRAVAEFRAVCPDVRLELKMREHDVMKQVSDGTADIAVLVVGTDVPSARGVRMIHLIDEPYRLVLPAGHPFGDRERIDLASLSAESWIHDGLCPGPCAESLHEAFASAGFWPNFAAEADSPQAAQGFVAAGLGVCLLPRLGVEPVHPGVLVREVSNPEPVRRIHLAVRESVADAPATKAMVDALEHTATW